MKRNIKFILLLLKLKLSNMMMFRISFFGWFLSDGMLFLTELLTFNVIYGHVESIGDWGRGQMIIFIGTFSIINAFNTMLFFFGLISLPNKIKAGDLDQYLTKPVSPLMRLTFENISPGTLPLVILSVFIVGYGTRVAAIEVSLSLALLYGAFVIAMTVLYYAIELILRTITFFVTSINSIARLEDHLLDLNFRVPGVLFKGIFKVLFYFIIPYGIMATVPTQLLSGMLSIRALIHAILIAVTFTGFALWFWKFGLKHYKSASS